MFAMAQLNAATPEAGVNNEATEAAATQVAPDEESTTDWEVSHPFKSDSEKHWAVETNGFYFGLGVKHKWEAINNSFEIGILNAVAVKYNSLHGQIVTLGVGIHHRSYSLKRPNMLVRDNAGVVGITDYPSDNVNEIKNRTSNLNLWAVQFPLMFRQRIAGKLEVGVAGILNWNTGARCDNHYELNKTDYDIHYKGLKNTKVNVDLMGTLTWNGLGLYCRYTPSKFFKDGFGPEIKNTWTMGLMIGL